MTLRLGLALSLLLVTTVHAQPATAVGSAVADLAAFDREVDALFTSGGLTAEQAATRARQTSPSVKRSVAEIEVAIAQALSAELVRIPIVGASASYSRLSPVDSPVFGDPTTGMGFQFPVFLNAYSLQASAQVTLSDYVVRYPKLIEAARLAEEVARVSKRSSEVRAAQEARVAFYEWVRSKLQVMIAQRQLAQVTATLGQVRALADAQRLSRADLMRVESNEAQAEQAVIQLHHLSGLREEQLRLLIGAPSGQPLTIGEDIRDDMAIAAPAGLDDLMGTARIKRLDFQVLDKGIEAMDKQRLAERSNLYPKVVAFAQADLANPNQRIFPLVDDFNLTWVVGAKVTWTLNETLYARNTDRRLRGEANELRADRESLERGTRIQILAAQQAVAVAQASLGTSVKRLAAAQEGYRVRRELLDAQRATAVELVDAETDLTRARIAALDARVDLRLALTQLANALGNDVK